MFLFFVDLFGRRRLLFISTIGIVFTMYYIAAFSAITDSFHTKRAPNAASKSAIAMVYLFGASFVSRS